MHIDEFRQLREDSSFHLLAYIADVCSFDCSYCYNRRPRTGKTVDLLKLRSFLSKMHEQTGKRVDLELIGGEPLLHPSIMQFIEQLPSYVDALVYTNGCHPIEILRRVLALNCRLFISWHSQSIRFLDVLTDLIEWKDKIDVSVMYEPNATAQACKVFDSSVEMGFRTVLALVDGNKDLYSSAQLEQYHKRHTTDLEYEIKTGSQTQQISEEDAVNLELSFKNWICHAGEDYLYVHFDENVYKCQTFFTNGHQPISSLSDGITLAKTFCPFNRCECGFGICKYRVQNIIK